MPYLTAWIVVWIAGVLGAGCLYVLTRSLPWPWLRRLLRWLVPVLLLVPAPIPGSEGNWAPAFVIIIFEALLQRDGTPGQALQILSVVVVLLAAGIYSFRLRRRRRADSARAAAPRAAS